MGSVKNTSKFKALQAYMLKGSKNVAYGAGQIVLTRAKDIITEKDFISHTRPLKSGRRRKGGKGTRLGGHLRRSGHVSQPRSFGHAAGDVGWRVTISFPVVYAPWIEYGKRTTAEGKLIQMINKEPGFLMIALNEKIASVRIYMQLAWRNLLSGFSG